MAWALVCPASRGIGFYLTRYILQQTHLPVIATTRRDVTAVKQSLLNGLEQVDEERLRVLQLDVTDEISISRAAQEVKTIYQSSITNPLYLSFCMPGILHPEKSPAQMQHDEVTETFAVNTIGPLMMIKHFSPFLPRKRIAHSPLLPTDVTTPQKSSLKFSKLPAQAVWLNMSARVGSITDNNLGGWYSYRASKAAINSITKSLDLYLLSRSGGNAMAISYHPGTVKTGLSKDFWATVPTEKLFTPEFAVEKMWNVLQKIDQTGRGKCYDWKGEVILP